MDTMVFINKKIKCFAGVLLILITLIPTSNVYTQGEESSSKPNKNQQPRPNHSVPPGLAIANISENEHQISTSKTKFSIFGNENPGMYKWAHKSQSDSNSLEFSKLIEYKDINNDLNYGSNEEVLSFNLIKNAKWNLSELLFNDSIIIFSLYTSHINEPKFERLMINLTNYIESNSSQMKFDIEITNWPWISSDNRLAFIMDFDYSNKDQNNSLKSFSSKNSNPTNGDDTNGLYISNNENSLLGFITSSSKAYSNYTQTDINVTTQIDLNNAKLSATYILNYPFFGDLLIHDPIIGTSEDITSKIIEYFSFILSKTTLFIITTTLLLLSVATLVIIRRKKN